MLSSSSWPLRSITSTNFATFHRLGVVRRKSVALVGNKSRTSHRACVIQRNAENSPERNLTMEEVRRQKRELRKEIRASLKHLSDNEITAQSHQVWERLFALPQYQKARSVGLFMSMNVGEIQTDYALKQVLRDKKALFVPRVGLDFELYDMDLVLVDTRDFSEESGDFYSKWPRNKWGIPEPPMECTSVAKRGDIDLLVVPGVAFDRLGSRLGQGKGYYDRFIASIRLGQEEQHSVKPLLVAVGLTPQYLGDERVEHCQRTVPVSHHDFEMDLIITPTRTVVCKTPMEH